MGLTLLELCCDGCVLLYNDTHVACSLPCNIYFTALKRKADHYLTLFFSFSFTRAHLTLSCEIPRSWYTDIPTTWGACSSAIRLEGAA